MLFDTKFMFYDIAEIPRKVVSVMNDEKKHFLIMTLYSPWTYFLMMILCEKHRRCLIFDLNFNRTSRVGHI